MDCMIVTVHEFHYLQLCAMHRVGQVIAKHLQEAFVRNRVGLQCGREVTDL